MGTDEYVLRILRLLAHADAVSGVEVICQLQGIPFAPRRAPGHPAEHLVILWQAQGVVADVGCLVGMILQPLAGREAFIPRHLEHRCTLPKYPVHPGGEDAS